MRHCTRWGGPAWSHDLGPGRMKVTIVGTGRMGRAIASRAVAGGHEVEFIGTHISKAQALADEMIGEGSVQAADLVQGDLVVVAVRTARRRSLSASTSIS